MVDTLQPLPSFSTVGSKLVKTQLAVKDPHHQNEQGKKHKFKDKDDIDEIEQDTDKEMMEFLEGNAEYKNGVDIEV